MIYRTLLLMTIAAPLLLLAPPAHAQEEPSLGIDVQRFVPAGSERGFVLTWDGSGRDQKEFGIDVVLGLARRPLSTVNGSGAVTAEAIELLFAGHAHAAIGATDWLEIDLTMAFMQFARTGEGLDALGGGTGDNRVFSLGDMWLEARFQPLSQEKQGVNLGVAPFITFPTGNPNIFLTSGLPTLGVKVAVGRSWKHFRIGGHFGYRFTPGVAALASNFVGDDSLLFSAGVGVSPLPGKVDVFAEVSGETKVGEAADASSGPDLVHTPMELSVTGRFQVAEAVALLVGGGPGLTAGVSAPEGRVFVGVSVTPSGDPDGDGITGKKDECPKVAEDFDGFEDADGCPDLDNDGDGIADADDRCPDQPEDKDGFEDGDGCPDLDNDGDGIADTDDGCPAEAEDKDGWEDEDGCPDRDNDFDEIPDADDDCPMSTEDFDGWQDEDGCPEDDNDQDGLLDFEDLCPNRAEVTNGFKDEDGCPDDIIAVVSDDKIIILEKILFKYRKDRILRKSRPVLEAVAKTLLETPRILKVQVGGHTDSKGSERSNQRLSEKRAKAVVKALKKLGVSGDRLSYAGFGESQPVAENESREGRQRNRRVEFVILEQEAKVTKRGVERTD